MAAKRKGYNRAARSARGGDKQGKNRKRHPRKFEMEQRLDAVALWLTYGRPSSAIVAMAKERWSLSERQAWEYITKVQQRWAEQGQRNRTQSRQAAIRRLFDLALRAAERGRDDAVARYEALLLRVEGTTFQPGDELRAQGDIAWSVKRNRNPEVPPPATEPSEEP